jgi:Tfp pilus assembly major pilin PilA
MRELLPVLLLLAVAAVVAAIMVPQYMNWKTAEAAKDRALQQKLSEDKKDAAEWQAAGGIASGIGGVASAVGRLFS